MCLLSICDSEHIAHELHLLTIYVSINSGGISMYTSVDLSIIYDSYFTVLGLSDECCELQSNNTKHCWQLKTNNGSFYTLYHKHHMEDPYHYQAAYLSLQDCFLDIANHDEYQLRGRKPPRYQPRNTFFDIIIKTYQEA